MMWLAGLLIPATMVLLWYGLWRNGGDDPGRLRRSVLLAALLAAIWTVAGTELLSLRNMLSYEGVLAWWGVGLLAALGAAYVSRKKPTPAPAVREPRQWDAPTAIMAAMVGAVLLATGIIALATPTNTWDCLQYHLPRQFYWIQQQSVAHFPSLDLRQVEMPPFSEYASLHMWILTGMDRWGNMVQWLSFALAAVAASLVALEAGLARRGQMMAALFVIANPSAATQATNGKNDVVVALWVLVLFWIAVRVWRTRGLTVGWAMYAGAALGLAVLTKGTAYMFAFPVCLMLGVAMLRARGIVRAIPHGLALVAAMAALNVGHWSRNYATFGSPLSVSPAKGGIKFYNTEFTPRAVVSNLIRNAAIHSSLPEQVPDLRGGVIKLPGFAAANEAQTRGIQRIHDWIGQDMNTRETTFGVQTFAVKDTWYHDGNNPAPALLLLMAVVVIAALVRPRLAWRAPAAAGLLVPFAGMLFFIIMLRWQPWHARLHIPALALLAPVGAAVVVRLPTALLRGSLVVLAGVLVWPAIVLNHSKPLLGRNSIFRTDGELMRWQFRAAEMVPINEAAAAIRAMAPRIVGVDVAALPGEYATLWTLRRVLGPNVEIREFRRNWGPPISQETTPEVVLVWVRSGAAARIRDHHRRTFSAADQFGQAMLYKPGDEINLGIRFVGWMAEEGLFRGQGRSSTELLRWGHGERTVLEFASTSELTRLVLEAKPGPAEQVMTIRLNGEELHRLEFGGGGGFEHLAIEFRPLAGKNELVFEYARREREGAPRDRAVLFQRLQIVPLGRSPDPAVQR